MESLQAAWRKSTSCTSPGISWQLNPFHQRPAVDCWHTSWPMRNDQCIHQWLDISNSRCQRHGQFGQMCSHPPPCHSNMLMPVGPKWTHPSQNNVGYEQATFGGISPGHQGNPWIAYPLPPTPDQAPGQQICCLDSSNQEDVGRCNVNRKDPRDNHRSSCPSWSCYPIHSSLHEPTTWSPRKKEKRHMINVKYRKDLKMMLGFLKIANNGISMNSLPLENPPTFIARTHVCMV